MKTTTVSLVAVATLFVATQVQAGPKCTEESKDKWISETQMMQKIEEMGYKNIRNFHVSKGKCYEIYGFDKQGKKVEVYFHPVTGEIAETKVN